MKRFAIVASIIILPIIASALSHGEDKPSGPANPTDATYLLATWAAPGAPEKRGTTKPPDHTDLAMENYDVNEPFAKVWEFYAAKCGCKQPHKAGQNIETGGGDKYLRYLVSLVHNSGAGAEVAQCTIAVNSDSYTILIHLSAANTQAKKTWVNLIADVR